jgi:hypothetical protein
MRLTANDIAFLRRVLYQGPLRPGSPAEWRAASRMVSARLICIEYQDREVKSRRGGYEEATFYVIRPSFARRHGHAGLLSDVLNVIPELLADDPRAGKARGGLTVIRGGRETA